MSSIMRRRRGLISAIGNLLSEDLGFDTLDPLRQEAIYATGHSSNAAPAASFNQWPASIGIWRVL
jgi:hypothetical protein